MATPPELKPTPPALTDRRELRQIERLSYLLDNAIRIPGIGYRIGYDAILGLIPGIGDAVGLALSAYIIFVSSRFGVPKIVVAKMVLNTATETLAGFVPIIGDVFDATWKANQRNLYLLHEHLGIPRTDKPPSNRRVVLAVLATITVIVLLIGLVVFAIVYALVRLLATG